MLSFIDKHWKILKGNTWFSFLFNSPKRGHHPIKFDFIWAYLIPLWFDTMVKEWNVKIYIFVIIFKYLKVLNQNMNKWNNIDYTVCYRLCLPVTICHFLHATCCFINLSQFLVNSGCYKQHGSFNVSNSNGKETMDNRHKSCLLSFTSYPLCFVSDPSATARTTCLCHTQTHLQISWLLSLSIYTPPLFFTQCQTLPVLSCFKPQLFISYGPHSSLPLLCWWLYDFCLSLPQRLLLLLIVPPFDTTCTKLRINSGPALCFVKLILFKQLILFKRFTHRAVFQWSYM